DVPKANELSIVGGNSYSSLFLDYDLDSRPDLLVTEHARFERVVDCLINPDCEQTEETPRLFRNVGADGFVEVTQDVGLTMPLGTVQVVSADFNCDGWPDLLFANGSLEPSRQEPSRVLLNDQGRGFVQSAYLPGFEPSIALGVAVAEIPGGSGFNVYLAGEGMMRVYPSHD
ncbi:MAG: FG-GAP repeat domain-containing protein, partial [bacterium]